MRTLRTLLTATLFVGLTIAVSAEAQVDRQRPPALLPPLAPGAAPGWIGIAFERGAGDEVIIANVFPQSPAGEAGLRAGDRIVRWNGRIDVEAAIREGGVEPGDTVTLRVEREAGGRDLTLVAVQRPGPGVTRLPPRPGMPGVRAGQVRVMRLPSDSLMARVDSLQIEIRELLRDSLGPRLLEIERRRPAARIRVMQADSVLQDALRDGRLGLALATAGPGVGGAELRELTPGLSDYFGAESGVLVLRVAPDTPAARAGLEEGDVIVRAGDDAISSPVDVRRALLEARGEPVDLEVVRRGSTHRLQILR